VATNMVWHFFKKLLYSSIWWTSRSDNGGGLFGIEMLLFFWECLNGIWWHDVITRSTWWELCIGHLKCLNIILMKILALHNDFIVNYQKWSSGVTFHALGSVRECKGMNPPHSQVSSYFGNRSPHGVQNFQREISGVKIH